MCTCCLEVVQNVYLLFKKINFVYLLFRSQYNVYNFINFDLTVFKVLLNIKFWQDVHIPIEITNLVLTHTFNSYWMGIKENIWPKFTKTWWYLTKQPHHINTLATDLIWSSLIEIFLTRKRMLRLNNKEKMQFLIKIQIKHGYFFIARYTF